MGWGTDADVLGCGPALGRPGVSTGCISGGENELGALDTTSVTLFRLNILPPGNGIGKDDFDFSFFPACSTSDGGAEELPPLASKGTFGASVGPFVNMLIGRVTETRDMDDSGRLWPKSDVDGEPGAVEPLVLAVDERAGFGLRS